MDNVRDIAVIKSVLSKIVNEDPDLGNYYQLSGAFYKLSIDNVDLADMINQHTDNVVRDIILASQSIESFNLVSLDHCCVALRSFIGKISEVLKIYLGFKAKECIDNVRSYCYKQFHDGQMVHNHIQLIADLREIKTVQYHQVNDLIRYVKNLLMFEEFIPDMFIFEYCTIIREILADSSNLDNICRHLHHVVGNEEMHVKAVERIVRNVSGLLKYADENVEKCYVKYLQIRLLMRFRYEEEKRWNDIVLKSKRVNGLIGDMMKSKIINKKVGKKTCRPFILNRKIWDIYNTDIDFVFPKQIQDLLTSIEESVKNQYHNHKISWQAGLGSVTFKKEDVTVHCNMFQASVLCLLNENDEITKEIFIEKTRCDPKIAEIIFESIEESGLVLMREDKMIENPDYYGDAKMDLDGLFRKLLSE